MRTARKRVPVRTLAVVVAGLSPWLASGRAEAQWGWGGWGGFYNPENASVVANQVNQRFLIQAQSAAARANQGGTNLANNPNSYMNHMYGDQFLDRYDASTRRRMEEQVARRPGVGLGLGPPPAPAPAPARTPAVATGPVLPITSFFNRYDELVWPADAPVAGDMAGKRTASDKASLAVCKDVKKDGHSPVASVTDARSKLLDYGKPALAFLRANTTPRISDTFHLFLLSLYDSLGQAANPPKTPAGGGQ